MNDTHRQLIALAANHGLQDMTLLAASLGFPPELWGAFQTSVALTMLAMVERGAHAAGPEALSAFESALAATRDEVAKQAAELKLEHERAEAQQKQRLHEQRVFDRPANEPPKGSA